MTNGFRFAGSGTHYVVRAYEVRLDHRPVIILDGQHGAYRWMNEEGLRTAIDVRENTKAYFR